MKKTGAPVNETDPLLIVCTVPSQADISLDQTATPMEATIVLPIEVPTRIVTHYPASPVPDHPPTTTTQSASLVYANLEELFNRLNEKVLQMAWTRITYDSTVFDYSTNQYDACVPLTKEVNLVLPEGSLQQQVAPLILHFPLMILL